MHKKPVCVLYEIYCCKTINESYYIQLQQKSNILPQKGYSDSGLRAYDRFPDDLLS